MTSSRREFLLRSCAGLGLFTFTVAGCDKQLTPQEAREQNADLQTLTIDEAATLDTFGDVLVPGSARMGLSHYVDHQLAGNHSDSMLMIRYLGVPTPYNDFYRGGITALDATAEALYSKPFSQLSNENAAELVAKITSNELPNWVGPPAGFFMFVVRADAADVYYGTQQGFEGLGVPYMAHIAPTSRWGE